jgi:hypothetical protein
MTGLTPFSEGGRHSRPAAAPVAALLLVLAVPARGADCNGNGIDDALDLAPRDAGFAAALFIPLDREPVAVAAADLDGDGRDDAAVATAFGLTTLLSDGQGGLSVGEEVVIGSNPQDVVAADLDGDGDLDVATANAISTPLPGNVSVLLNAGDGSLAAPRNYAADQFPAALVAADLDGDGDRELAAANVAVGNVSILLNHGDGTFTPAEPASLGGGGEIANSLAAVDLDGDGDADLASAQRNSPRKVSVLLNDGPARFPSVKGLGIDGANPLALAVDDFDGDRDADLMTSNQSATNQADGGLTIFANLGGGNFAPARPVLSAPIMPAIMAGDMDQDGDPDLALGAGSPELALRFNAGDASFETVARYSLPAPALRIRHAEMDGAGPRDLVIVHGPAMGVSVATGRDTRWLWAPARLLVEEPDFIAGADLDGDGDLELASGGEEENALLLFTAMAGGAYGDPARYPLSGPTGFVAVDLDGDLDADLAVTADEGLWIFPGVGGASFAEPTLHTTDPASTGYAPVLADLDADGDLDVVFATTFDPWLNVAVNGGGGAFTRVPAISGGEPGYLGDVRPADLEGDGDLDFISFKEGRPGREAAELITVRNDGTGRLTARRQALATQPWRFFTGDFNGDERLDALLEGQGCDACEPPIPSGVGVHLQDAEGAFPPRPLLDLAMNLTALAAADFDGDRDLDLVFSSHIAGAVWLARNDGTGRFGTPDQTLLGSALFDLEAGDFDGDLDIDLAAAAGQVVVPPGNLTGTIDLFLNDGRGTFSKPVSSFAGTLFGALHSADIDGDGLLDLIVLGGNEVVVLENRAVPPTSLDRDRDGVPDECGGAPRFHRGDATGEGALNITDPVALLNHLFRGTSAPDCREAADADNDGTVVLTDAVVLLQFLFQGGPPPPAPGPPGEPCGPDPDAAGSPGDLGCGAYGGCGA